MPGASRKNLDTAGDKIIQGSEDVLINGEPAVRLGDAVEGHGRGSHRSPTMAEGCSTVFVNGIPLVRAGHRATCGHEATGSEDVFAE